MRPPRLTIRTMMVAVAAVAALSLAGRTYFGNPWLATAIPCAIGMTWLLGHAFGMRNRDCLLILVPALTVLVTWSWIIVAVVIED